MSKIENWLRGAMGQGRKEMEVNFSDVLDAQRGIDGSLLEESVAIWCALLRAQQNTWTWEGLSSGDYLEIGVLNGKSASVLAHFSRAYGNCLTIVDPIIQYRTRQTLDAISPRVSYLEIVSENLRFSEYHRKNLRSLSFAHIDGMHRFSAVMSDIAACEDMLGPFGVISIDDFHTDLFPQIPAAVYRYLYSGVSDLCIFLIGFNKAYLCRNIAKKYYMRFVREGLLQALEAMGKKLTLVKTDRNDNFNAFAIAAFQGERLYGNEHET